jgi:hypothetical protein
MPSYTEGMIIDEKIADMWPTCKTELSKQYMLDTNIFGFLVERAFRLEDLPSDGQFWATPVQRVELSKAPNNVKAKFKELILDQKIVFAGFAFSVPGAGWGEGEWRQDGKLWRAP